MYLHPNTRVEFSQAYIIIKNVQSSKGCILVEITEMQIQSISLTQYILKQKTLQYCISCEVYYKYSP